MITGTHEIGRKLVESEGLPNLKIRWTVESFQESVVSELVIHTLMLPNLKIRWTVKCFQESGISELVNHVLMTYIKDDATDSRETGLQHANANAIGHAGT